MLKKEMSIKEFIEQPEIKTLIDKGMMTVNAKIGRASCRERV